MHVVLSALVKKHICLVSYQYMKLVLWVSLPNCENCTPSCPEIWYGSTANVLMGRNTGQLYANSRNDGKTVTRLCSFKAQVGMFEYCFTGKGIIKQAVN